jgi:hypothetical protein
LLFAVWIIRKFIIVYKNLSSAGFPLIIASFPYKLVQINNFFGHNSGPLLSAILIFAGLSQNVTPANNEGLLYWLPDYYHQKHSTFGEKYLGTAIVAIFLGLFCIINCGFVCLLAEIRNTADNYAIPNHKS